MPAALTEFVVCPSCTGTLLRQDRGSFRCRACDQRFPAVGRVPCLLPVLKPWMTLWQTQLAVVHQQTEAAVAALEDETRKPGLLPLTARRLQTQIDSQRAFLRDLDDVLVPAVGKPQMASALDREFEPLKSFHLLFRDWGWPGSNENAHACARIQEVLTAPLGRLLVIGAGACRLAYDLHLNHGADTTVALDVDPLVLTVAERIISGGQVPLMETRVDAPTLGGVSARRTLRAPHGPVQGLHVLLADGLRPPLKAESFDTILTPWFIDQIPPDLRVFVGVLRRHLKRDGRWLNFGPLIYPPSRPSSHRHSQEELFELARRAGFSIEKSTLAPLPYSVSPLSGRGKLENCLAFCARATTAPDTDDASVDPITSAPPPADANQSTADLSSLPSWIVLPFVPVPDFPGRQTFQHESAALRIVIGLIDGKRSVDEIAAALATASGVNNPGMDDTVRYCLMEAHPACRSLAPAAGK